MNKKDSKLVTILLILIMLSVITMSIGIVNNYYMKKSIADSEVKIVVQNVSLLISYDLSNKIVFKGLTNELDYNYNFTISNNSKEYGVGYKLKFNIENNTEEVEGFNYSLKGNSFVQNDADKLVEVSNKTIPVETTELGSGYISNNQSHYYSLNIKYNGEPLNDKLFIGYVSIEKSVE